MYVCVCVCKINKQKPQSNTAGRPEGGLSPPAPIAEPRRNNDSSSFLARTQPMKSHGLFVYCSPPCFCFPLLKPVPSFAQWLAMAGDPKLQSFADPK